MVSTQTKFIPTQDRKMSELMSRTLGTITFSKINQLKKRWAYHYYGKTGHIPPFLYLYGRNQHGLVVRPAF